MELNKLYTLKANNSSRRLDSQSYRDLNIDNKNNENIKDGKQSQNTSSVYSSCLNERKKHTYRKISTSETPKLRSQIVVQLNGDNGCSQDKSEALTISDSKMSISHGGANSRPSSHNQLRKQMNTLSNSKYAGSSGKEPRRANISIANDDNSEFKFDDEEYAKRVKIQEQIANHIRNGTLEKDSIITPVMSSDGQIRQYILNDLIHNPNGYERLVGLLPGSRITNTTVDKSKWSTRRNGIVKAYSANTNKGLIRNYNEDRVSIILNILKPNTRKGEEWPKCSFFGVFDGHGGAQWADFLRDNLHQFVIKEPSFPGNPEEALKKGFQAAENAFL